MSAQKLITDHLDLWTSAVTHKSGSGRGASGKRGKIELTGIKKLRELILELAVRGKLVEQDPSDEPASVLLERITEEKNRLIKEEKIKKPRRLPDIVEEEKSFELPETWTWIRLGNISQINPRNDAEDNLQASFIPMPLISTSYHGEHGQETRPWGEMKKGYTHFADGDIAIAKITPCFENSKAAVFHNLNNGIGAGTTELHVARPFGNTLNSRYVLLCLKSPRFLSNGEQKMTGSAGQKRVPKDFFAGEPLPFPPWAEQHRIVEKVDELMALCDRLERQVGDQLEAHEVLVDTLLDTLTRSTDANELAENWARLAEHFDTLFTTEAGIDKLKQTILQVAVMGRLVKQKPDDEPASVLLEKLTEEKERIIKEGKLRKQKSMAEISVRDTPFRIPKNWKWVAIDSVALVQGGIQKQPKRAPVENYYPYLRVTDVQRGKLSKCHNLPLFEIFDEELEQYRLNGGDILIVEGNGSSDEIGRCAIWDSRIPNCVYQNHLIRVRPTIEGVSDFIALFLNSPSGIAEMKRLAVTTSGLYNLSVGKIRNIKFPLPPLEEQHRIVEKVEELMALCDQLKARLGEAGETRTYLAEAVVEQAVS